jgi:XRE family transcriptional regulator, regulator of sulfur utilization
VEFHKSFGQRIRAVRTKARLSREFVAERVGIGSNYLGQIERGEKWPALEVIVKIATVLSVSPATFFDFEVEEINPQVLRK